MKRLLHFEFHRLFRQKSFYICFGVMFCMLFLSCLIGWVTGREIGTFFYSRESILRDALSLSYFFTVLSVYIPILVCEDYEQQTVKNIFSRGYTGGQIYFAKLIASLAAGSIMAVMLYLAGGGLGLIFFEADNTETGAMMGVILCQYFLTVCYVSLYYAVSISIRKVGGSIALSFFFPLMVGLILNLVSFFMIDRGTDLGRYWISNYQEEISIGMSKETFRRCIAGSCLYSVLFVAAGRMIGKGRDNR